MNHVTKEPWVTRNKGTRYGPDATYLLAAEWLKVCNNVADWGGGRAHFAKFLPADIAYMLVDGTLQVDGHTRLADLAVYRGKSEGILLRHVLEMDFNWKTILINAVAAFEKRMVIVTFTPNVETTFRATWHLTWPVHHFAHEKDLIPLMQPYLVRFDEVLAQKNLPERVYYLEKSHDR